MLIDIFIPTTRKRPDALKRTIESLLENTTGVDLSIHVIQYGSTYAEAINWAYGQTSGEWFFCGADDLKFYSGWLEEALKASEIEGSDQHVGVVGTNDLHNPDVLAGTHATHYLVLRKYITAHGGTFDGRYPVIFNYKHNYTDTEFIETAKARGQFVSAPKSIVEHMHYVWGLAPLDEGYTKSRDTSSFDFQEYSKRKTLREKSNHENI